MIFEAAKEALLDGAKLLPFLFITYLAMEYLEHKTSQKTGLLLQKSGRWGFVFGGVFGVVPQCGFSAAASNLYAGRIITLGTLLAVFLSTSDEMLPILISEHAALSLIVKILLLKAVVGMTAGALADLWMRKRTGNSKEELRIEQICDHQHCHCSEENIFRSALCHTVQIFAFILLVSFLLNLLIEWIGEAAIASFLSSKPVLGPALAGIVGLIPNCASSVVLTQLYLEGVLGAGAMISGLLSGTGVGLLVLFRVNDDLKENVKITLLLYAVGVLAGIVMELLGIAF
ncbi:MAG: arsenic efflux protein [Lachnospiraceae bacterium]|nr:arsenic efflux protein [Lachnospiraceae bacterium]